MFNSILQTSWEDSSYEEDSNLSIELSSAYYSHTMYSTWLHTCRSVELSSANYTASHCQTRSCCSPEVQSQKAVPAYFTRYSPVKPQHPDKREEDLINCTVEHEPEADCTLPSIVEMPSRVLGKSGRQRSFLDTISRCVSCQSSPRSRRGVSTVNKPRDLPGVKPSVHMTAVKSSGQHLSSVKPSARQLRMDAAKNLISTPANAHMARSRLNGQRSAVSRMEKSCESTRRHSCISQVHWQDSDAENSMSSPVKHVTTMVDIHRNPSCTSRESMSCGQPRVSSPDQCVSSNSSTDQSGTTDCVISHCSKKILSKKMKKMRRYLHKSQDSNNLKILAVL